MKKYIALLLSLLMMFALCACAKNAAEPTEGTVSMPNPLTEYESLAEINEIVGGNLVSPAVMGVSDKAYIVYDCGDYKIAEYKFEVAGYEYNFRCAVTDMDISGLYLNNGEDGTAFKDGKCDTVQFNSDDEFKCARYFDGDMQYVLSMNDKGEMDQETFESIADELMMLSIDK